MEEGCTLSLMLELTVWSLTNALSVCLSLLAKVQLCNMFLTALTGANAQLIGLIAITLLILSLPLLWSALCVNLWGRIYLGSKLT